MTTSLVSAMAAKVHTRDRTPSSEGSREDYRNGGEPSPKRRKFQESVDGNGKTRMPGSRRKTACQSCRMRKVKCDAIRPTCGICKASDTVCKYTDPLPEKLTLDSATELLSSKLDRLQEGIERLHENAHINAQLVNNHSPAVQSRHDDDDDRPRQSSRGLAESSKDFLQIPAHRTTADAVLNWEVFEGTYPPMALISVLFSRTEYGTVNDMGPRTDHFTPAGGLMPVNEEHIPILVDKFLENVHTKNPVLDVEQLVKQARIIAATGLGWDGWSCLVLLASALGTIAKPFESAVTVSTSPGMGGMSGNKWIADPPTTPKELQQAESYFTLASRRLGSLKHSILGAQCYFFAGVYLMYTLRPLVSWQYFIQASHLYQLYMKTTHGLAADISQLGQLPIQHSDIPDGKRRRLEECLYWSCFKSESEFRVELPLPQSELSNYQHPQLFPSPPSPAGLDEEEQGSEHISGIISHDSTFGSMPPLVKSNTQTTEELDLREHAKKLCNEEESWYYYLTEIALRRIGNRVINTFFTISWVDIRPLLGIALEFDTQVSAWSAHLPAAMQHWETNYTIRAPSQGSLPDGTGNHVSRELSWATDNRLLEMRSWLFQPFLYYLIHRLPAITPYGPTALNGSAMPNQPTQEDFISAVTYNASPRLSTEDASALYHFITSGIELNLKILDVRSLRHRHHGLWYDMRSIMTAALILLAVVKSGQESWIPRGPDCLWGDTRQPIPPGHPVQGKIGHALSEFEYWTPESPDLLRHRDVLEEVTRSVRGIWIERKSR